MAWTKRRRGELANGIIRQQYQVITLIAHTPWNIRIVEIYSILCTRHGIIMNHTVWWIRPERSTTTCITKIIQPKFLQLHQSGDDAQKFHIDAVDLTVPPKIMLVCPTNQQVNDTALSKSF